MKVNLGNGFGPLDFDENGKMFSIFPENLPYISDDYAGDEEYAVYVDAELVEAVCNAGLDFEEFLRADEEERQEMLEDAGLDPGIFDLDFDHDLRQRLEEEGLLEEYYDEEDDFDDEDEFDDEEDEADFYDEEDENEEDYEDIDEDEFPEDEDFDDGEEDEFFGDLH